MGRNGKIRFQTRSLSRLRFDLTCHMPDLPQRPLSLEFLLNGTDVGVLSLAEHGWTKTELDLRGFAPETSQNGIINAVFEIRADRT